MKSPIVSVALSSHFLFISRIATTGNLRVVRNKTPFTEISPLHKRNAATHLLVHMTNSAKNLKEPDWKAIRKNYENTQIALKDVAAGTGMSMQKIVAFAHRAGWKPRTSPTNQQRVDAVRDNGLQPARLATRLKRLIAREIDSIEGETHSERPAADAERDARRLATLVRSLEKLNDIKAAKAKREGKDDDGKGDDKKGGQDMRAELARRLARIAAGEPAPKFSGEPEPGGN